MLWATEMAQHLRACNVLAGLGLGSQHPHDSSQVSVTPVPGNLMLSSGLYRHCMHVMGGVLYTCRQNTHAQVDVVAFFKPSTAEVEAGRST